MQKVSDKESKQLALPPITNFNINSELRSSDLGSSSEASKLKGKINDSRADESKFGSSAEEFFNLELLINKKKTRARWQISLDGFLEHLYTQIFLSIINVFALFADDIRCLAFGKSSDNTFFALLTVAMAIFISEIVLCSLAKESYFLGFYFWIDIISTISMIGDIGWIMPTDSAIGKASDIMQKARVVKVIRVVRLVRLIRLLRVSKLYKEVQKQKELLKKQEEIKRRRSVHPINSDLPLPEQASRGLLSQRNQGSVAPSFTTLRRGLTSISTRTNNTIEFKESNVSKKLSEATLQSVVLMIVVMIFCLPLLLIRTWIHQPFMAKYASYVLNKSRNTMSLAEFQTLCKKICDDNINEARYPLIYVNGPDCGPYTFNKDPDKLRDSEKIESRDGDYLVIFDYRPYTRIASALNLAQTVYICIVLAVGSIIFSYDNNRLLLEPFEGIMEKVNKLSKDPMWFCLATSEDGLGIYSFMNKQKDKKEEKYEMQYLEALIIKIAKLLAVEFGEAGSRIIVSNLNNYDFLNPMVPGVKLCAVFGFCIINSFAETTELLQTKVIIYLNQIAEIIHSTVDKYFGATNKNIGEAFLLLWKLEDFDIDYTTNGPVAKSRIATTTVDLALFAYLKIIAKINKLKHILSFGEMEEIREKLPHYKLKMGFGLHVGWGIEGAIGSIYKIDASYLSPNVNICSRLQAATKQYGVPLLISGHVYQMLSNYVKKYCREIDTVTVKGSVLPIKLYTVDVNTQALRPKECKYEKIESGQKRATRLKKRKAFHEDILKGRKTSRMLYASDKDLDLMRAGISTAFLRQFEKGYKYYIDGDWFYASECFKKALVLSPNDGPTFTLLQYMEMHKTIAPPTWQGYRMLTEK